MTSKHATLIRFVWRVKENGRIRRSKDERKEIRAVESHRIALFGGETTRHEHYGGGSSNHVAEEEVSGKSRDGNERVQRDAMLHVTGEKNESKGVELVTLDVAGEGRTVFYKVGIECYGCVCDIVKSKNEGAEVDVVVQKGERAKVLGKRVCDITVRYGASLVLASIGAGIGATLFRPTIFSECVSYLVLCLDKKFIVNVFVSFLLYLVLEKNRKLVIKLYPELPKLARDFPPIASFNVRVVSLLGGRKTLLHPEVKDKQFKSGEPFVWALEVPLTGRFIVDVEFLDLKITSPNDKVNIGEPNV
ncbi:hypothetical protein Tco_0393069 [Tanacetum coccineum]